MSRDRQAFARAGAKLQYAADRTVDIVDMHLAVRLDPAVVDVVATARLRLRAFGDVATRIELDAVDFRDVACSGPGGEQLRHDYDGRQLAVTLAAPLAAGEETEVAIAYAATPRHGLFFIGPSAAHPGRRPQVWSQCQDTNGRHWFPCVDAPHEKATTTLAVTVPERYQTLGNGVLEASEAGADGWRTDTWRQDRPHPAYLVTLIAGEFAVHDFGTPELPLPVYVRPDHPDWIGPSFDRTPEMVAFFSARFGVAYPFPKYAQAVVEDFIFGGMENTSATTLVDRALYPEDVHAEYDSDDLLAHELAHQWFGDLVTCRDWTSAWLNESFATFCEAVWFEHHRGADWADHHRLLDWRAYVAEDGRYRRRIEERRFVAPLDMFDRHLYEKGGLVLAQLRHELGEESFWRAIARYLRDNSDRNVVTDDLRRAIETETGRNMEWFFDQWVRSGGHPEVKITLAWEADTSRATVTAKQTHKVDDVTPRFRFDLPLVVGVGDERRHGLIESREESASVSFTDLTERPAFLAVDPRATLPAAIDVEQSPAAWRALLAATDLPARARIGALEPLARDASTASVDAVAAALADPSWGVGAEAAAALGRIRTDAARAALQAATAPDSNPRVRRAAAAALGTFRGDAGAAATLRGLADDSSIFVRAEALTALGRVRFAEDVPVLARHLRDGDAWLQVVRAGAARGLGASTHPDAEAPLRTALGLDNDVRVRLAAAAALGELGARFERRVAIREALEELLRDADFRMRRIAVEALGTLADPAATVALRAARDRDVDGRIANAVDRMLGGLTAERPDEIGRLSDQLDELRRTVAEMKEKLGGAATVRAPTL